MRPLQVFLCVSNPQVVNPEGCRCKLSCCSHCFGLRSIFLKFIPNKCTSVRSKCSLLLSCRSQHSGPLEGLQEMKEPSVLRAQLEVGPSEDQFNITSYYLTHTNCCSGSVSSPNFLPKLLDRHREAATVSNSELTQFSFLLKNTCTLREHITCISSSC